MISTRSQPGDCLHSSRQLFWACVKPWFHLKILFKEFYTPAAAIGRPSYFLLQRVIPSQNIFLKVLEHEPWFHVNTKPFKDFENILCFIMVALWNRADHYIFALWFLLSFFFLFFLA